MVLLHGLSQLIEQDPTKSPMRLNPGLVVMATVAMATMYYYGIPTVILVFAGLLFTLVIGSYHPLVPGMKRTWKIHFLFGFIILTRRIDVLVSRLKGKQPFPMNIVSKQLPIVRNKPPKSASYGQVKVTREEIAGVPVIVYRPDKMSSPTPALVFMRGAGFVLGNADLFDWTVYEYARRTNIMAILVECGRAPQHPFPEPHNDNLEVTKYILEHGANLDIDVNRVGVGGDSAGGLFAASVATTLATDINSDLPNLKFQVLQVPTLQCFDMRLPSYQDYYQFVSFIDTHGMAINYACYMGYEGEKMAKVASILMENAHISPELRDSKYVDYVSTKRLPSRYQQPQRPIPSVTSTQQHDPQLMAEVLRLILDPRMSPLMAPDVSRLPPTFIEVAEFDILRDDGLLYASRLEEAGVEVQVHFSENGFHCDAVKLFPDSCFVETGQKTLQLATEFITKILHKKNED